MMTQVQENKAILARLDRVERQHRRLKLAGALVLAIAAAGLLMGQAVPRAAKVEGEEFVLQDTTGKIRAKLAVSPDGTVGLFFLDKAGKIRAGWEVAAAAAAAGCSCTTRP